MRIILSVLFVLILLVGCSAKEQVKEKDEPIVENQTEQKNKATNEEEETPKQESEEKTGLNTYRPEVGTTRVFTNKGEELYTQQIVAENDEYVQIMISIGGSLATQIYKWTADEITLVFEDMEASNPSENILDNFTPNEKTEVLVSKQGEADWEVVEENSTLTVPYGELDNVLVIRKVTDEVVGADTIYTRYFAPSVGLVKESYEVTGDSGYKDEANLSDVKK